MRAFNVRHLVANIFVFVMSTSFFSSDIHASPEENAAFIGAWQGQIEIPNSPLEVFVDLDNNEQGEIEGTITIPAQNASKLPLEQVVVDSDTIKFSIANIPGTPTFDGALEVTEDLKQISGSFTQGGGTFAFELRGTDVREQAKALLGDLPDIVRAKLKDFDVPGAALAIVWRDKLVFAEGFGYADVEEQRPMTPDTLFAVGSTTKAMTTTLMGMLADEDKLDFDAPVRTYLPGFTLADEDISRQITLRDLVTHRSGMPRHDILWYAGSDSTRADLIDRFKHLPMTAGLRERYQYNNLMFMTAGHVAANAGGYASWETLIRERLFDPLGMQRSNLSVTDSMADANHATPYSNREEGPTAIPYRNIDVVGPAGSVNSTVREMTEWLRFNLNGGAVDGTQLIKKSTLADIQAHHMVTGNTGIEHGSPPLYGLGWRIDTYRGKKRIYHGGGIDGFITNVMLFPGESLGLVSFTNTSSGLPTWLNLTAADLLLEHPTKDWLGQGLSRYQKGKETSAKAKQAKDPRQKSRAPATHPLAAYAGTYEHPGYGAVEVAVKRKSLVARYHDLELPLTHWHYNVWRSEGDPVTEAAEGLKLKFSTNLNGDIAHLRIGFEVTAEPLEFTKQPDAKWTDPAHLSQYTGSYTLDEQNIEITLQGDVLSLEVAGQPPYELSPEVGGYLRLGSLSGFHAFFPEAGNTLMLLQPNGNFEATRRQ